MLVFLVLAGNSFGVTYVLSVQYSCAVVSVFLLWHKSFITTGKKKFRVVSHLFTGSSADIGKLPALAGWYIWYGIYGIFCTVRFGGSSIL